MEKRWKGFERDKTELKQMCAAIDKKVFDPQEFEGIKAEAARNAKRWQEYESDRQNLQQMVVTGVQNEVATGMRDVVKPYLDASMQDVGAQCRKIGTDFALKDCKASKEAEVTKKKAAQDRAETENRWKELESSTRQLKQAWADLDKKVSDSAAQPHLTELEAIKRRLSQSQEDLQTKIEGVDEGLRKRTDAVERDLDEVRFSAERFEKEISASVTQVLGGLSTEIHSLSKRTPSRERRVTSETESPGTKLLEKSIQAPALAPASAEPAEPQLLLEKAKVEGYIKIFHQYVRSITYDKAEIARIIAERFKQHERRYHKGDGREDREGIARRGFDQQPQNRAIETSRQVSSNPSKSGQRCIPGEEGGNTSSLQRSAPWQPSPGRYSEKAAEQMNPRLPPADLITLTIRLDKLEGELLKRQTDEDGQGSVIARLSLETDEGYTSLREKVDGVERQSNLLCSSQQLLTSSYKLLHEKVDMALSTTGYQAATGMSIHPPLPEEGTESASPEFARLDSSGLSVQGWMGETRNRLQKLENSVEGLTTYVSTVEGLYRSDVSPRLSDPAILDELVRELS